MTTQSHRLCAHIKTNGEQCEAIALTDDRFCYFHSRDRQRQTVIERFHRERVGRLNAGLQANICFRQNAFNDELYDESAAGLLAALELPLLEDANAIQVTATNILRLIALQQIDRKHAALMLYGLQICSGTLDRLRTEPSSYRPVATSDPEPLRELAAMLAELRARKKAAASATLPEADNNPENEVGSTGTNE